MWGPLSGRGQEREPAGDLGTFSVLLWAMVMGVDTYVKILAQPDLKYT